MLSLSFTPLVPWPVLAAFGVLAAILAVLAVLARGRTALLRAVALGLVLLALWAAGLPRPAAVLSVYPIGQGDTTTASYLENANNTLLSRSGMTWFFQQTLASPDQRRDPRISLPRANLRGLPPVTIVNADIDVLRDDGAQLERALRAAGVPVERRVYPGVTHEFFGMAAVVRKAADAQQYAGQRFRQAFGR